MIDKIFTFERGIRNDREIGLVDGSFGLIGKAAQDCGTRTAETQELGTQAKKWEPKRLEILLRQCWKDLDANMGRMARKLGLDVYNLEGTDYLDLILAILQPDLNRTLMRKAWLDDTSAALVTASPSGVITAGQDITYFNLIDGLFAQLEDIVTGDSNRGTTISENSANTGALQDSTLTNQEAYEYILQVIDDAEPALRAAPDQMLLTTGSIGRKAMRYLQAQGLAFTIDFAIKGLKLMTVDGIPIWILESWDEWVRAYQRNTTGSPAVPVYNAPHRIVYTTKSNLVFGMEGDTVLDRFDVYHDKVTKYTYIEAIDAFDVKVIQDNLVQYGA